MAPAGEPVQLRPLSLGEIFDRAVTLYVRNAALFSRIVLAVVVPVAILNYFASLHESASIMQLLAQIQNPAKGAPATGGSADTLYFLGMIAISVFVGAFVVVAIAAAVGEIYRTGQAHASASFSSALRRAGGILVAVLCEIAVMLVVIFAGAIAMSIVFAIAFLLFRSSPALGVTAFIAGIIVAIVWLLLMLLCYVAFAFAYTALGIEGVGGGSAIARGFSRIFNRGELLRATLVCLALVAIYIGLTVVSVSVAALFESVHLHVLTVIVSALISLVTTAFLGILLAVYYFDVRVRREGLDIAAEIEGMQSAAAPS